MPKVKLTNTFLTRVKIPLKEKIRYVDAQDPNLIFEVKNNKQKSFYCRFIENNKTKYKKLLASV